VAALVDTNVLVYRHDPRFPEKQRRASELLRTGLEREDIQLSHQALVEFVAAVSRTRRGSPPLLRLDEALLEAEELLSQFPVVYPSEAVLRTALRGCAAYQLPWFDAQMWALAEVHGLSPLYSEDFQPDRMYGTVRVIDPFRA
jgi:predicted nucleic acid-binding protein